MAVERLADDVLAGLDERAHGHLTGFAVRVRARRLGDASWWLAELGARDAAEVAGCQARLLGCVQHRLVAGDVHTAAATLRRLAATHEEMHTALAAVGQLTGSRYRVQRRAPCRGASLCGLGNSTAERRHCP